MTNSIICPFCLKYAGSVDTRRTTNLVVRCCNCGKYLMYDVEKKRSYPKNNKPSRTTSGGMRY